MSAYMQAAQSVEWETPAGLFEQLDAEYGPFTLDVAATDANAKCANWYTIEDDALVKPWMGVVWCNPPYDALRIFMAKAISEVDRGNAKRVVMLIPARTDTQAFHLMAFARAARIEFLRGRVRFGSGGGTSKPAPFPSCVVVFDAGHEGSPVMVATDRRDRRE